MHVSRPKTNVLHVQQQDPVSATSTSEALAVCKFKCPHLGCDHWFHTQRGVNIHAGTCEWKAEFVVDHIVNHKGTMSKRMFLIRWAGYDATHDSWQPRSNVHPDLIKEYEVAKGVYDFNWPHRCDVCDLPCASARGVKIHRTRMHKDAPVQSFADTLADKAVRCTKVKQQQNQRPDIYCNGTKLDNVYMAKCLGTLFPADGDQMKDISARVAQATTRCGQLHHIFSSDSLPLRMKLRLYEAAVVSLLTYGSETWFLNPSACRKLRGANSRMLAWFTGNSIPHEARPATTSFNIIQKLRSRRLRWVGHILLDDPQNPSFQALKSIHTNPVPDSLLMDTSTRDFIETVVNLVKDRAA